jgi:hypothetical protein
VHPAELATTRRSLHGIAELVLAGPEHRRTGEIALRVTAGSIATVAEPPLSITAVHLVSGERTVALDGATCAALAAAVGVEPGPPEGLYHDGSGVAADEPLQVDPAAAAVLLNALHRGDQALRRLAPEQTPILWPEHFDIGISVDAVNYGVSPGDGFLDAPYAYVGPWRPREGEFWNAPFGAAIPLDELSDAELDHFLARGRELTGAEAGPARP